MASVLPRPADPFDAHRIDVTLLDGTRVVMRPIRREDKGGIADGFERLSDRSRFMRFLGGVTRLTPTLLARLTEVDHVDHEAWVAMTPDEPDHTGIGVARYVRLRDEPDIAEPAVTVVDAYQNRGVGSTLLELISAAARANGVKNFRAYVSVDNYPMLHIMRRLGAQLTVDEPGIMRADIPLATTPATAS
jgi:GNAT superfamily N-acetyltransferase